MIIIIFMNFLFAIATTIGMTVIPFLVTESLGLSLLFFGMMEGSAELLSNILRLASGNLFDRIKNRKLLFIIPSVLATLSKMLLFVPTALTLVISKLVERISNGMFAVPRDAYVGAVAKKKAIALACLTCSKGLGCAIGPLLVTFAIGLLGAQSGNTNWFLFLLFASLLTLVAAILSFFVDTKKKVLLNEGPTNFSFAALKPTFMHLRILFILVILFFLGRFNDGVIMLYLKNQGFPQWFYLSTIAFFNSVIFFAAPTMAFFLDMKKYYPILLLTIIALLSFNILFYNISLMPWVFACVGLICWGIQRAGAQIIFTVLIMKKTPVKYYGTTLGVFSILNGLGTFVAATIGGHLAGISFSYIFILSGSFALLALIFALCIKKHIQAI